MEQLPPSNWYSPAARLLCGIQTGGLYRRPAGEAFPIYRRLYYWRFVLLHGHVLYVLPIPYMRGEVRSRGVGCRRPPERSQRDTHGAGRRRALPSREARERRPPPDPRFLYFARPPIGTDLRRISSNKWEGHK